VCVCVCVCVLFFLRAILLHIAFCIINGQIQEFVRVSFPPLPVEVGPLKPAISFPVGARGRARLKTNLVHSKAVRKPLAAIILSILKCMFHTKGVGVGSPSSKSATDKLLNDSVF